MAGPLSATQRVQAAKALFVARTIMRARQTRRAAMFDRLRAMVHCVCILPFIITKATGTLVSTPTNPRRRRGGVRRGEFGDRHSARLYR